MHKKINSIEEILVLFGLKFIYSVHVLLRVGREGVSIEIRLMNVGANKVQLFLSDPLDNLIRSVSERHRLIV